MTARAHLPRRVPSQAKQARRTDRAADGVHLLAITYQHQSHPIRETRLLLEKTGKRVHEDLRAVPRSEGTDESNDLQTSEAVAFPDGIRRDFGAVTLRIHAIGIDEHPLGIDTQSQDLLREHVADDDHQVGIAQIQLLDSLRDLFIMQ